MLLVSGALTACNSGSVAGNNQTLQSDASHTILAGSLAASSINHYLNQLSAEQINNANPRLEQLRQSLISYYSKVQAVQTVQGNGYTVDCIPFDQQPGLINASHADKATADALNKQHLRAMARLGNGINKIAAGFDFKMTMCSESTVALARLDANNLQQYIKSAPPQQVPSQQSLGSQNQGSSEGGNNLAEKSPNNISYTPGYSWIQSYLSNGTLNVPGYFVSFISPDPEQSNNYLTESNVNGHSLNQLWWLDKQGTTSFVYSLEAGWMTQMFGQQIATELFVFSTNDGYNGSAADRYNQAGGFIQYTNTPAVLGTPLTSSQQFTLSFILLPNNGGYELDYSANGSQQAIGYYPMSRYPTPPNFNYLWYGSEVDDHMGLPVTMGGTITADGTLDESGKIIQSLQPAQTAANVIGEFSYSYVFNSDGSITYSGTNQLNPTPTPIPTNQPPEPTGVYTTYASAINWDGSHLSAVYNGITSPVLDYSAVCAAGSQVGATKDILTCYNNTAVIQNLEYNENFAQGFWPQSCLIQNINLDTSTGGCSNATAQNGPAVCIDQLQAYCQNSSGAYVETDLNPNEGSCYNSTTKQWNIALNSDGQLYCPASMK